MTLTHRTTRFARAWSTMRLLFVALMVAIGAVTIAVDTPAEPRSKDLRQCAAIENERARLACYDALAQQQEEEPPAVKPSPAPSPSYSTPPARSQSCCKICRKGMACGDSCISRNKVCHKGPGCACQG